MRILSAAPLFILTHERLRTSAVAVCLCALRGRKPMVWELDNRPAYRDGCLRPLEAQVTGCVVIEAGASVWFQGRPARR